MTKIYNARLATRITASVDTRLRQQALVSRRRISHVLDDLLDAALPTTEDLTAQFSRLASSQEPGPQDLPGQTGQAESGQPEPEAAAAGTDSARGRQP